MHVLTQMPASVTLGFTYIQWKRESPPTGCSHHGCLARPEELHWQTRNPRHQASHSKCHKSFTTGKDCILFPSWKAFWVFWVLRKLINEKNNGSCLRCRNQKACHASVHTMITKQGMQGRRWNQFQLAKRYWERRDHPDMGKRLT